MFSKRMKQIIASVLTITMLGTIAPIRYIAERLKANVIWVPKTRQIVIVK